MQTCPPRDRLEQLACNNLPAEDRAGVQNHLRECPACRGVLAQLTPYRPTETWEQAGDTAPEPTPEPPPPEQLRQHPRYRLLGILGRGGMGTVYKAEHRLLDRPVVLKVIRSELLVNEKAIQRFQQEARLAARLTHPNVVGVYEAEEFGASQLLVMEFVEGVNLSELVAERGLLPVAEACELIRQAAVGLEYIRDQGLIHRDIKPPNLLVSRGGMVKILDLGMATLKGDAAVPVSDMTDDRQFVGTVDYASPEQWESSRNLDIRADIYSLGCTFYYLLAGEAPFPHKKYTTMIQQMWAHSQAPLPPIREIRPDVPEDVAAVLTRMLAKDRDERFAAPAEIAAALAPFTQDCNLTEFVRTARRTTTSRLDLTRISLPGKTPTNLSRPAPRRKLLIGAAVLAVGLLAGVAALVAGRWGGNSPGPGEVAKDTPPAAPGVVPPAVPPAVPGPIPPVVPPSGPPIKVGILHSSSGTMPITERPVIDATELAIEELNAAGGVLGRPVVAVVEDGESDAPTFAVRAEKLISKDKVAAVFGCWTSASRKTAKPVFERHNHLLFYPVQYEGLEQSPNIVYTGAAPNQQIIPAVRWCVDTLKRRRLFLVGSDYVFPRTANEIIRDEAAELRAEVVGEEYVLFGSTDVSDLVRKIVAAQPDAILNTINGDSNVAFFRALRAAGITPDRIPTISFSISEEELTGLGTKNVVGDYAAWNYFQTVPRPQNREFVARFQAKHGKQRTVSDPMEAAYFGVHLWALAVRAAGTDDPARVRDAVRGLSYDAPGGVVRVDPETLHTSKVFRVGLITADGRFQVMYESPAPIAPIPYPNSRGKAAWTKFLDGLQQKWNGQWENPGKK